MIPHIYIIFRAILYKVSSDRETAPRKTQETTCISSAYVKAASRHLASYVCTYLLMYIHASNSEGILNTCAGDTMGVNLDSVKVRVVS